MFGRFQSAGESCSSCSSWFWCTVGNEIMKKLLSRHVRTPVLRTQNRITIASCTIKLPRFCLHTIRLQVQVSLLLILLQQDFFCVGAGIPARAWPSFWALHGRTRQCISQKRPSQSTQQYENPKFQSSTNRHGSDRLGFGGLSLSSSTVLSATAAADLADRYDAANCYTAFCCAVISYFRYKHDNHMLVVRSSVVSCIAMLYQAPLSQNFSSLSYIFSLSIRCCLLPRTGGIAFETCLGSQALLTR